MENSTDKSQKSKDVFLTMVGLLGLKTEVKDKISGKNIILSVSTDEPGRLIGRNGSSLDSVGLLMNRILKKEDIEFPKVIIDVDGYDKKSKRKRGGNRRDRSRRVEKTMVLQDEPKRDVDDSSINFYVEDDGDSLAPITTVALNSDSRDDRSNNRGRNNNNRGRNNNNRGRNNNNRGNNSNNRSNNSNNRGQTSRMEKPSRGENSRQAPNRNRNRSEDKASSAPVVDKASSAPVVDKAVSTPPAPAVDKTPAKSERSGGNERKGGNSGGNKNRLQMQCRNAAKEVKRWGESSLLPPMNEADCKKAVEYINNEKDMSAVIDSKSYGDKKRVRISLKKS